MLKDVLERGLPEKEKAQARELAPKFISVFRIANPDSNYDMLFGFILCVESATSREIGCSRGLDKILGESGFAGSSAAAAAREPILKSTKYDISLML